MGELSRTVAIPLTAAATLFVACGGASAQLAPHRAVYSMTLASASHGSGIAGLSGRMVLEVADACDGWTVEERIAWRIVDLAGEASQFFSTFSSWESKDGTRYRFVLNTKLDGEKIEEIRGRAVMAGAEGGAVYFIKPTKTEIALPAGTLFPVEHTVRLLARAESGKSHFPAIVFDGMTLDDPNHVSAFIGRPENTPELTEGSGPRTAWPVRLAFFSMNQRTPEPDVEIGVLLSADGVARKIDLVYRTFKVHAEIERLEFLPSMGC